MKVVIFDHLLDWSYITSHWQPDEVFLFCCEPVGEYQNATCIESLDDLPAGEVVLLAPKGGKFIQGETDLKDFVHPEDAIYVFGPNNEHINSDHAGSRTIDHKVFIETETHHEMWNWVAAAVTFYDRDLKRG